MSTSHLLNWNEFEKVDMRIGRIKEVHAFPEAIRPAYKLVIDFGMLGTKKSSAQITNYKSEDLIGRQVVAVVNFPSKQIGPFVSEVLVLGAIVDSGEVKLLMPDAECELGSKVS